MPLDALSISQGVPQIGIAYLAASLKAAGHRVVVVDALAEDLHKFHRLRETRLLVNGLTAEGVADRIPDGVDLVGVSCMFSNEWIYSQTVIQAIAERHPDVPIVAGGEHITADPAHSLRTAPGLDVCVLGEGEKTIVDIVDAFSTGRSPADVPGIMHRQPDGELLRTKPRARIRAIDDIPWPSWDEYPLETFLSQGFGFNEVRGRPMPVLASRGCPYQCTFCSNPRMWTTRWIARDPADVVREIKHYVDRYRIDHVEFYDLTTIVKKSWIMEFAKLLLAEQVSVTWSLPSGTRSEALDQEVLQLMSMTGCRKLTYAPESGSPATLKRVNKRVSIPNMLQSMRWAHQAGIGIKANLVFGFPGQTLYECFETYGFMFRAAWKGMGNVAMFTFMPYPGSEIFEQLKRADKIPRSGEAYDQFLSGNILGGTSGITSWSENLSSWQLKAVIVFGTIWFYGWVFLFRPYRLFATIWRTLRSTPETTLEVLIDGVIRNSFRGRKRRNISSISQVGGVRASPVAHER